MPVDMLYIEMLPYRKCGRTIIPRKAVMYRRVIRFSILHTFLLAFWQTPNPYLPRDGCYFLVPVYICTGTGVTFLFLVQALRTHVERTT
jgi:hypothetical protein